MDPLKIHRGNYEEYFLLYVDNELLPAAKQAVEDFAEANPDLKLELDVLLDTKLSVDDVAFDAKASLFKADMVSVETLQLLSIDHELNDEQADALAAFHRTDKKALEQFEWLQQTTLPLEEVIYPYKEKLYRRSATVLSMRWLTTAVAAAVLIALYLLLSTEKSTDLSVPEKLVAKTAQPVTNETATRITDKQRIEPVEASNKKTIVKNEPLTMVSTAVEPEIKSEMPPTTAPVETSIASSVQPIIETTITINNLPQATAPIKADFAMEALTESSSSEDEDHPKKGLRGFVRKASRIYTKITSSDENK